MDPQKLSNTQSMDWKPNIQPTGGDNVTTSISGNQQLPLVLSEINEIPEGLPKPTVGACILNQQKIAGIRKEDFHNLKTTRYSEGEVKYTTKDALVEMVHGLSKIKVGNTGCIIDKQTCYPECSKYVEGVHFESQEILGRGSFGIVDKCYDFKTKKTFVRKQIQKVNFKANEVIAPIRCNHPNITKFFGLVQRDSLENFPQANLELYLEYGGDSLTKIYLDRRRFNEKEIRDLTKQGLAGLVHMSLYGIVHLDVKPENLIIKYYNGTLQLKITDLGSSRLPSDRLEFVVTPEYTAPEVWKLYLQTKPLMGRHWGLTVCDITGKVDVYAFALVIMFMYLGYDIIIKVINNGKPTYDNMDEKKRLQENLMIQMIEDKDNDFFVQKWIPDQCSLDMRNVLMEMTHYNPVTRVSALQALRLIEDVSEECMETGPVKNHTLNLLRRKLQPYEKGDNHSKGSKCVPPMYPQQEMLNMRQEIASKQSLSIEPMAPRISGATGMTAPLTPPLMENPKLVVNDVSLIARRHMPGKEGLNKMLQTKAQQTAIPNELNVQTRLIPLVSLCHSMEESETPGNLLHFQEMDIDYSMEESETPGNLLHFQEMDID